MVGIEESKELRGEGVCVAISFCVRSFRNSDRRSIGEYD